MAVEITPQDIVGVASSPVVQSVTGTQLNNQLAQTVPQQGTNWIAILGQINQALSSANQLVMNAKSLRQNVQPQEKNDMKNVTEVKEVTDMTRLYIVIDYDRLFQDLSVLAEKNRDKTIGELFDQFKQFRKLAEMQIEAHKDKYLVIKNA